MRVHSLSWIGTEIISSEPPKTKSQFSLLAIFLATAGVAGILAVYRLLGLDLAEVAYGFGFLVLVVGAVFAGAAIIASRPRLPADGFVIAAMVTVTFVVCEVLSVTGAMLIRPPEIHGLVAFFGTAAGIVVAARALQRPTSESGRETASAFQFEVYEARWLRYVVILPVLGFLLLAMGILSATFWLPTYGVRNELPTYFAEYHQDPYVGLTSHYWPRDFAWIHVGIWPVWLPLIVAAAEALQLRRATISMGTARMRVARIGTAHALAVVTMTVDTLYWFNESFLVSSPSGNRLPWIVYFQFETLSLSALLWLPIGAVVVVTLGLLGPHRRELLRVAGWLYALLILGLLNLAMTAWLVVYLLTARPTVA